MKKKRPRGKKLFPRGLKRKTPSNKRGADGLFFFKNPTPKAVRKTSRYCLYLLYKFIQIFKMFVHRGEAYIGDLVYRFKPL